MQKIRVGRWSVRGTLGGAPLFLGLFGAACSSSPTPRVASTEMQAGALGPESAANGATDAFPEGTLGRVWDRRSLDISVPALKLRSVEEQELRWTVSVLHEGSNVGIDQALTHVTLRHNGTTIVDSEVKPGVTAHLVVDRFGTLMAVTGLEGASESLRSLAAPESAPYVAWALSPSRLTTLVSSRYNEGAGDVTGRPTRIGANWTTVWSGRGAYNPVIAKSLAVLGAEPCGAARCTRLLANYRLDPRVLADDMTSLLALYAASYGEPSFQPAVPALRKAAYFTAGEILTTPGTPMNRQAVLTEKGHVRIHTAERDLDLKLDGESDVVMETARRE